MYSYMSIVYLFLFPRCLRVCFLFWGFGYFPSTTSNLPSHNVSGLFAVRIPRAIACLMRKAVFRYVSWCHEQQDWDSNPGRQAPETTPTASTLHFLLCWKKRTRSEHNWGARMEVYKNSVFSSLVHHQKKCQLNPNYWTLVAKNSTGENNNNLSNLPRHLPWIITLSHSGRMCILWSYIIIASHIVVL